MPLLVLVGEVLVLVLVLEATVLATSLDIAILNFIVGRDMAAVHTIPKLRTRRPEV